MTAASNHAAADTEQPLGDFTASPRLLWIAALAVGIGIIAAFVAKTLIALIAIFTNLFFFHRWSITPASPADHTLGLLAIGVPVVGALIIGLMARYGSERIRGHGIPEAIEAILINGSRVQPKVAILKPLSSAISIGSGGPFGAEGPIIMTGGAVGSVIAQFFHLTSAERKTLLVAGAAAGMSATFAAPVASALLAVELLLFEWKPRSFVPVALAASAAVVVRRYIMGVGPLFPTPAHPVYIGPQGVAACIVAGLAAGALSALLTSAVYAAEDAFSRLPIHWMWWPAIGGLAIGVGGYLFPQALGIGFDTIADLLHGDAAFRLILGLLIVKALIWSISLGSGTSGGVLAPLLLMGGALGAAESYILPGFGAGFWPLVSMGAILGGTMRSPFTAVVFVVELTHDVNMLLPLLIAVTIAHTFTVLVLRRSILTEKLSRRGYHLSREYAIDPLEILFVREVMRTNIVALPADAPADKIEAALGRPHPESGQMLYPVVDAEGKLTGVMTRADRTPHTNPEVALANEPLRVVVHRMAQTGRTRMPVIDRPDTRKLVGMLSLEDLLKARAMNLEMEQRRERTMKIRLAFRP